MGCGGSKSTAVNERAPLMDGNNTKEQRDAGRRDSEDSDAPAGKTKSGYSRLPQEEDTADTPKDQGEQPGEAPANGPPAIDADIENSPPEKTTTKYTKLPPSAEDKEPTETIQDENKESDKPAAIAEEPEEVAENNEENLRRNLEEEEG